VTGFAARVATAVWVLVLAACLALSFVFTKGYLQELQKNLDQRGRVIGESVAREVELPLLSGDVAGLARIAARAYGPGLLLSHPGRPGAWWGRRGRQHGTPPEHGIGRQIWGAVLGVAPAVWEFRTPVTIAELQPRDEELTFFDHAAPPPEDGPQRQIGTVLVGMDLRSSRRATARSS
jgi:hypothetical protein